MSSLFNTLGGRARGSLYSLQESGNSSSEPISDTPGEKQKNKIAK